MDSQQYYRIIAFGIVTALTLIVTGIARIIQQDSLFVLDAILLIIVGALVWMCAVIFQRVQGPFVTYAVSVSPANRETEGGA